MLQGKLVLLALLCFAFALQAWGACTKFGVVSLSRSLKNILFRAIDLISFLHLPSQTQLLLIGPHSNSCGKFQMANSIWLVAARIPSTSCMFMVGRVLPLFCRL